MTGCMITWYRMLDTGSAHELAGRPGFDMGDQVERVHVSCVCAVDAPSAVRRADQEAHAPHAIQLNDILACEMKLLHSVGHRPRRGLAAARAICSQLDGCMTCKCASSMRAAG